MAGPGDAKEKVEKQNGERKGGIGTGLPRARTVSCVREDSARWTNPVPAG